ncbi:MAG: DUF115 domain-containing protein [Planctomycetes bacterium]|nr:DUF115 domain-containing protein [Planctomycetota bacterium]
MTPTLTQTHLDSNLAALGERNAEVVAAIREAGAPPGLAFSESRRGPLTARLGDAVLASAHHPAEEARRLAETVDVVEHATIVVLGFGLGYHVQALAERIGGAGLIVVYEPDVALLRAVLERIDHAWMADALLLIVTDPDDRGALARKLDGAEAILAQGTTFLAHPASRRRLAETTGRFQSMFADHVSAARTTFLTTLIRAVDTVRNLLYNIDHYVDGPGVAELAGVFAGRPAIVVSAGPSLSRNLHLLAEPNVRERCVIVAAQTTLKPLLAAGIRPHFVTALDFHEISRRFYDGLRAEDVQGVTLVVDPKAHPEILDAFPGTVRCCRSDFLDKLLGDDLARDRGELPAGATVAHLCLYLARYLGCGPIALIGQDLCFPDGIYYAPGTAIHEVWGPELNPFNTIAMMEWQRIARHRANLHRIDDVHGRSVFTDAQMLTYLRQFERDFAELTAAGVEIIDATEGGAPKQHTTARPLREVLERHLGEPLPELPATVSGGDPKRRRATAERIESVRREIVEIRDISRKTIATIDAMLAEQSDEQRMARHFDRIEKARAKIDQRFEAFTLLNFMNQLGVFRRSKADRRIEVRRDLDATERQRLQLERDLVNVQWLFDAARELEAQLADAAGILRGRSVALRRPTAHADIEAEAGAAVTAPARPARIAALIPVDLRHDGRGIPRSLATTFAGRPVLQATLERLGAARGIESIVLVTDDDANVDELIDRKRIGRPVHVERCGPNPAGPEREALGIARRWSGSCWRGGIGGASVYDEVLWPQAMREVMERRDLDAGLLVGPDWPLVDVSSDTGCDALAERHREHPDRHRLVFTQAPPGIGACIVGRPLMEQLCDRSRLATIGSMLVYQPHAPQGDPIATEANVTIDPHVRNAMVRATFDTPRQRALLERALAGRPADDLDVVALVHALANAEDDTPAHVIVESAAMSADSIASAIAPLARLGDVTVTLTGMGSGLSRCIDAARGAGACAVHVRTDLGGARGDLDALLAADVVSVDLPGNDAPPKVLESMQHLIDHRRHFAGPRGAAAIALPWIVPRFTRHPDNVEQTDAFFERWQHVLGTVVIDGETENHGGAMARAITPEHVLRREQRRTLVLRGPSP